MWVHVAIHRPKPGKEKELIDSMHRFGAAMRGQPGLQQVHTLQDAENGVLMGLAIWDSEADWQAAVPLAREAVKDDNFDDWEDQPPEIYHFQVV